MWTSPRMMTPCLAASAIGSGAGAGAGAGADRPLVQRILSAASLLFLGLFATKFVLNQWAF
jgi:hypothetical protein